MTLLWAACFSEEPVWVETPSAGVLVGAWRIPCDGEGGWSNRSQWESAVARAKSSVWPAAWHAPDAPVDLLALGWLCQGLTYADWLRHDRERDDEVRTPLEQAFKSLRAQAEGWAPPWPDPFRPQEP